MLWTGAFYINGKSAIRKTASNCRQEHKWADFWYVSERSRYARWRCSELILRLSLRASPDCWGMISPLIRAGKPRTSAAFSTSTSHRSDSAASVETSLREGGAGRLIEPSPSVSVLLIES